MAQARRASLDLGWASVRGSRPRDAARPDDEKVEMQGLNERLAEYIGKVHYLEGMNHDLEVKIKELLKRNQSTFHSNNSKFAVAEELCAKIKDQIVENAHTSVKIENARLAAEDFRNKFETEQNTRVCVDVDILKLHALLEEYNAMCVEAEVEVEALGEEIHVIRKNQKLEMDALGAQLDASSVSVEVADSNGTDLNKILADLRQQYEAMIVKSHEEMERAYKQQMEVVKTTVVEKKQASQLVKEELSEMNISVQSLQKELDTLRGLIRALENQLRNTEACTADSLSDYGRTAGALEAELAALRSDTRRQLHEYSLLLNEKMKLEQEISTYRTLLESGDGRLSDALHPSSGTGAFAAAAGNAAALSGDEDTCREKRKSMVIVTQYITDGRVTEEKEQLCEH